MKKLVYIGFAFKHHKGNHAGYHHIKDYIMYDYVIDCQDFIEQCDKGYNTILGRIYRHIIWRITGFPLIPFFYLRLLWINLTQRDVVFHFVYGENLYIPFFRYLKRKSNKIVCTLHQPYSFFEEHPVWLKRLKTIDEIILVSNSELSKFEKLTGKNNIFYIPHGVDTDFYSPLNGLKDGNVVLTVGNWLRDYSFANEVYKAVLDKKPNLKIVVVANPNSLLPLETNDQIEFCSGISDVQLRALYCKSSVLFLPLKRFTANNAILEAGACGCSIVIASDSQDTSYLPDYLVSRVPLNVNDSVTSILNHLNIRSNLQLSQWVKDNYSWSVVGSRTENYLKGII